MERSTALGARTSCWKRVRPDAGGSAAVVGSVTGAVVFVGYAPGYVGAEVTVLAKRAARAMMLVEVYILIAGDERGCEIKDRGRRLF